MFHQINQAQRTLNSISQMVYQMRQSEENNRQILSQLEQKEARAAQQLRQVQQMCDECNRLLQNVSGNVQQGVQTQYQRYQPGFTGGTGYSMGFEAGTSFAGGRDFGPTMNMAQGTLSTESPLIDRTTMGAETYQNSLRQFGGTNQAGFGGISGGMNVGGGQNFAGTTLSTQSPLIDPTTSNPSTYQNTVQQFSGQTQGIVGGYASTPNIGSAQNLAQGTLRTESPLIDPATMNLSTYESSLRQFGGGAAGATGQTSGFTSGAMSGTMGATMGGTMGGTTTGGISMSTPSLPTNETFASVATMGPDTYQASAQRLGGSAPDLRSIGQQAGISGTARGYNQ
ncbi:MAG: hypothetical protein ACOY3J_03015 [Bacillota bacterium]|uniref:Uncharacterized protein n=1 Tax=Thermanaerosceptrum fracticalcis TaxID=1712410 RepID=A0A7G6E2R7_THEFR|nr:hypothetical protein [Thermanaerosceptrum fracticalcis]QNB46371.1 hypothetical protein BR63_08610 [Thermanaerosceptrum fracticalcis]